MLFLVGGNGTLTESLVGRCGGLASVLPRFAIHIVSIVLNVVCLIKFRHQEPQFPKWMICLMNGCFILIGLNGIPELLRDCKLLEFVNGTAILILTILLPRALTFLAWQCYTSTQLFMIIFLHSTEQAKLWDKSCRIALGILFNVIISSSLFVGFTAALVVDYPGNVIAMVLPIVYAWVGIILTYAAGWHLDRKYPKVERLPAGVVMETTTNTISSLRLFNRLGGFVHCVLMLVVLFYNLLKENTMVGMGVTRGIYSGSRELLGCLMVLIVLFYNLLMESTVVASLGGLSISLFLWRTLEAQRRANIKNERTPFQADVTRSTTRSSYVDPPLPTDVENIELDFVTRRHSPRSSNVPYTSF